MESNNGRVISFTQKDQCLLISAGTYSLLMVNKGIDEILLVARDKIHQQS
jgi:hypothetical protein